MFVYVYEQLFEAAVPAHFQAYGEYRTEKPDIENGGVVLVKVTRTAGNGNLVRSYHGEVTAVRRGNNRHVVRYPTQRTGP